MKRVNFVETILTFAVAIFIAFCPMFELQLFEKQILLYTRPSGRRSAFAAFLFLPISLLVHLFVSFSATRERAGTGRDFESYISIP